MSHVKMELMQAYSNITKVSNVYLKLTILYSFFKLEKYHIKMNPKIFFLFKELYERDKAGVLLDTTF